MVYKSYAVNFNPFFIFSAVCKSILAITRRGWQLFIVPWQFSRNIWTMVYHGGEIVKRNLRLEFCHGFFVSPRKTIGCCHGICGQFTTEFRGKLATLPWHIVVRRCTLWHTLEDCHGTHGKNGVYLSQIAFRDFSHGIVKGCHPYITFEYFAIGTWLEVIGKGFTYDKSLTNFFEAGSIRVGINDTVKSLNKQIL